MKQRWFFLFNDMLVYASVLKEGGTLVYVVGVVSGVIEYRSNNKYIFHGKFSLLGLRLEDLENDKMGKNFGGLKKNISYLFSFWGDKKKYFLPFLIFSGKHAFLLVTPVKSFVVHANTNEEKIEWMLDICNSVDDWKTRKATFGGEGNTNQQFEAPGTLEKVRIV
jgi:hypothetical protein